MTGLGDVDGDGHGDLAAQGGEGVYVVPGSPSTGAAADLAVAWFPLPCADCYTDVAPVAGDVDGDGLGDVFISTYYGLNDTRLVTTPLSGTMDLDAADVRWDWSVEESVASPVAVLDDGAVVMHAGGRHGVPLSVYVFDLFP